MNTSIPEPGFRELAFGNFSTAERAALLKLKTLLAKAQPELYAPPEASISVSATTVNSGFRLEWAPVPGAKRYLVYRGTTTTFSASTTQLIGSVDEQLEPGTRAYTDVTDQFAVATYPSLYYWVRAVDDVDEGPISAMATVTNSGMITSGLQTSASNPKVVIDSANGIRIYDDGGNVVAQFHNNTLDLDGTNATLTVDGGTITGSTFKTAASGERVEIDSTNGVRIYDSGGNLTAQFKGTTLTLNSTSATITGATFKTAASGQRVEIDGTNGVRVYDASNLIAQFNGTTGNYIYGTYTPTISSESNLDDANINEARYIRIGDAVIVSALGDFDITAASATFSFNITLPVSSNNFANEHEAGGTFTTHNAPFGRIYAVSGDQKVIFKGAATDTNAHNFNCIFMYKIV